MVYQVNQGHESLEGISYSIAKANLSNIKYSVLQGSETWQVTK